MIGGRSVRVLKILAFENKWLNRYYNIPIREIMNDINNFRKRREQNRETISSCQTEERMTRTIPYSNNAIIVNQISPRFRASEVIGSNPVSLICLFCKNSIITKTTYQFNCKSFCLCCMVGCIFYACIQLCRGKGLACEDVAHNCPCCGSLIGVYRLVS